MPYQDENAKTIARWIEEGWQWGTPIDHDTYEKAVSGDWDVLLTPVKKVPHSWFGELKGKKLLGLASGGGQQIPVFSARGAVCTVLDYCQAQLDSEIMVAEREGYEIRTVCSDMSKPLPFEDESFDIVFHPVSNCYIEKVKPLFRECFRILKKGGILLCGLDNGINYIVNDDEREIVNSLPFNPLKNPDLYVEDDGYQFSHTFAEQIGGQTEAGFIITDADEDTNGEGRLHELNIPTFWMTRAVKPF